jgi:hypothetical protein
VLPASPDGPLSQAADLAASGRRVLALAYAPGPLNGQGLPPGLRAVAFILLEERLRSDAPDTIAYFAAQGVALKVISGDSPHTVSAVAKRAGVPRAGDPVDARDLPEDPEALGTLLEEHSVTLAIGVPAFFLALAPNRRRYVPGFVGRVLRFAGPAGLTATTATPGRGSPRSGRRPPPSPAPRTTGA